MVGMWSWHASRSYWKNYNSTVLVLVCTGMRRFCLKSWRYYVTFTDSSQKKPLRQHIYGDYIYPSNRRTKRVRHICFCEFGIWLLGCSVWTSIICLYYSSTVWIIPPKTTQRTFMIVLITVPYYHGRSEVCRRSSEPHQFLWCTASVIVHDLHVTAVNSRHQKPMYIKYTTLPVEPYVIFACPVW